MLRAFRARVRLILHPARGHGRTSPVSHVPAAGLPLETPGARQTASSTSDHRAAGRKSAPSSVISTAVAL